MAKIDPEVMRAVEAELKKNPDASVDELQTMAHKINEEMGRLTKRQFHARYPLQVKRKMAPPKPRKKKRKKSAAPSGSSSAGGARDQVRDILLRFASNLAAAEDRADAVRVVAGVDAYVDDVLKATR